MLQCKKQAESKIILVLCTVLGIEDTMITMAFVVSALTRLTVQWAGLVDLLLFLISHLHLLHQVLPSSFFLLILLVPYRDLLTRPKSFHVDSLQRNLFINPSKIYHLASFHSLFISYKTGFLCSLIRSVYEGGFLSFSLVSY